MNLFSPCLKSEQSFPTSLESCPGSSLADRSSNHNLKRDEGSQYSTRNFSVSQRKRFCRVVSWVTVLPQINLCWDILNAMLLLTSQTILNFQPRHCPIILPIFSSLQLIPLLEGVRGTNTGWPSSTTGPACVPAPPPAQLQQEEGNLVRPHMHLNLFHCNKSRGRWID